MKIDFFFLFLVIFVRIYDFFLMIGILLRIFCSWFGFYSWFVAHDSDSSNNLFRILLMLMIRILLVIFCSLFVAHDSDSTHDLLLMIRILLLSLVFKISHGPWDSTPELGACAGIKTKCFSIDQTIEWLVWWTWGGGSKVFLCVSQLRERKREGGPFFTLSFVHYLCVHRLLAGVVKYNLPLCC